MIGIPAPRPASPEYDGVNKNAATLPAGAPVCVDASGVGVQPASAVGNANPCVGLLRQSCVPGALATVVTFGNFKLNDWTAVTGSATLAPRATYYLSETTGLLTNTPPSAAGDSLQIIGVAVDTLTLDLNPEAPILLSGGLGGGPGGGSTVTFVTSVCTFTGAVTLTELVSVGVAPLAAPPFTGAATLNGSLTVRPNTNSVIPLVFNAIQLTNQVMIQINDVNGILKLGIDTQGNIQSLGGLFIGTGQYVASIDNSGSLTAHTISITAPSDTSVAGKFQRHSATINANILQCNDQNGNPLAGVKADGSFFIPTLADSSASNSSLYFSSTTNKLTYKDSSGTLHAI